MHKNSIPKDYVMLNLSEKVIKGLEIDISLVLRKRNEINQFKRNLQFLSCTTLSSSCIIGQFKQNLRIPSCYTLSTSCIISQFKKVIK